MEFHLGVLLLHAGDFKAGDVVLLIFMDIRSESACDGSREHFAELTKKLAKRRDASEGMTEPLVKVRDATEDGWVKAGEFHGIWNWMI